MSYQIDALPLVLLEKVPPISFNKKWVVTYMVANRQKKWRSLSFNSAVNSDLILLTMNKIWEPGIGRITMTEETIVYEEKHIPAPFCLPWITHGVATWWQIFTSVGNGAKERNSLLMELNPKVQAIAIHLETCNIIIIWMALNPYMISGLRHEVDEKCTLLAYYIVISGNFLLTFQGNERFHLMWIWP